MSGQGSSDSGRRLVLTADDFGYDRASDALILELLAEGAVTATTVIAPSNLLEVDARGLVDLGGACGVHLTTSSDGGREPWSPVGGSAADALVEPDGFFPADPAAAEERATVEAVTAEVAAQHGRLMELGLAPNRVDSHSGTIYGLHGRSMLEPVLVFCAQHGLGLRLPKRLDLYVGDRVPEPVAQMHAVAVSAAERLGVRLPVQMATNQVPADRVTDYEQLRDGYISVVRRLPEGTSEIFLHPGAESEWARQCFGRSWDKRVFEARLLRDPLWLGVLETEGIELVGSW